MISVRHRGSFSNLEKFSTFKYWGTEAIRVPKQIEKNGFRAVNTGYSVAFSDLDEKDKKYTMKFEAQGKGKMVLFQKEQKI